MEALIDGDVFKWRWAAAGEYDLFTVCDQDDGETFSIRGKKKKDAFLKENPERYVVVTQEHIVDPVENVLHSVKVSLEYIKKVTGCKKPRIFLGGSTNFRDDIYPKYKESRKGRPKPHHYQAVVDYLLERWDAEIVDGYEADDALAICQHKNSIICSQDKDLLQVPGWHFDFVKDKRCCVTRKEGDFFLYQQVITGDSTDDIPGVKGLGPVRAAKILEGATSTDDLLSKALEAWGGCVEDMLLTARLVYLKRSENDDFVERPEVARFLHRMKDECSSSV